MTERASASPPALPSAAMPVTQWRLHSVYAQDDARLLPLFADVFGHAISPEEWAWKYADNPLRGVMLSHDDRPVAFFGGMARSFHYQGKAYLAVQNGDVMVHPSQRGVFTRRGALYQVASRFFSQYVGPGRPYAFAFGFPNSRHMRLGLKLGVYQQAGQLQELRWPATLQPLHRRLMGGYVQPMWPDPHEGAEATIDGLWRDMQTSWPELFLPCRDSARWVYRYRSRPGVTYDVLLIRQRLTGRPLAALALREHPDHVHWLDYVGASSHLGSAITAARTWAARRALPLRTLVNDTVSSLFSQQGAESKPSDIMIPANASPETKQNWLGRLWLMGGDSDFM